MGNMVLPFTCLRCGYSCTQIVVLSDEEVARIAALGHDPKDFREVDGLGRKRLKLDQYGDKFCHFFRWEDVDGKKRGKCTIYNARPDTCRKYPFFPDGTAECSALGTMQAKNGEYEMRKP